nr:hypothetical protein BAR15_180010 [Bartonella sp. AR 15-3]
MYPISRLSVERCPVIFYLLKIAFICEIVTPTLAVHISANLLSSWANFKYSLHCILHEINC